MALFGELEATKSRQRGKVTHSAECHLCRKPITAGKVDGKTVACNLDGTPHVCSKSTTESSVIAP